MGLLLLVSLLTLAGRLNATIFRTLLAPLTMSVCLMPGDHDDRHQLRQNFSDHTYLGNNGFVQYSVAVVALQLIAPDTLVLQ